MIDAALDWAVQQGPPNGVFLFAVLTQPSTWAGAVVRATRSRLGLDDDRGDGGDS